MGALTRSKFAARLPTLLILACATALAQLPAPAHAKLKVELMFGTHEAKYQIKKWVEDHHVDRIERFSQSIGEAAYSEIELAIPGATIDDQIDTLSNAFVQFTGAPLESALMAGLRTINSPQFALGQEGIPSAPVWFEREWKPFYKPFVGEWHQ